MITPNYNFNSQKGKETMPTNWALISPNERVKEIVFEATCKKCKKYQQCHWEKDPCNYKKRFKRLVQALPIDEQINYLQKVQKMDFEEIEKEFSNIMHIMDN